jgi:hypothetical protein
VGGRISWGTSSASSATGLRRRRSRQDEEVILEGKGEKEGGVEDRREGTAEGIEGQRTGSDFTVQFFKHVNETSNQYGPLSSM